MEDIHPVNKLTKASLCELLAEEGIFASKYWTKGEILSKFPPYIRNLKGPIPSWKRRFIQRNRIFWEEYKCLFPSSWLEKTRTFMETQQKLEWHLGEGASRDLMDHMIHTRPSGIRVSKLNYIPALVAMAQIPLIGPWGRRLSPREAANAQSFGRDFILHEKPNIAFKQLGNSVNVVVVAKILKKFETLVINKD